LDALHDRLLSLGANGAKLLGAGGGGFFLVHGDTTLREHLIAELGADHRIIPLTVDFYGSRIIHDGSE
jgi:galactokinase/mevalonate kinase-like predicted kinase